jgi:hypothetical protein
MAVREEGFQRANKTLIAARMPRLGRDPEKAKPFTTKAKAFTTKDTKQHKGKKTLGRRLRN